MQECEICGKREDLVNAIVEGTTLGVCSKCSKFGKVLAAREEHPKTGPDKIRIEKIRVEETLAIVSDCSEKIKNAREKKGMTQKELGKEIAEKESLIHKMESGKFEPPLDVARKLEHFFEIKLIEIYEEQNNINQIRSEEPVTIGDLLKKKNEKT